MANYPQERRWICMGSSEAKKVLAGFGIAALLAGVALAGCKSGGSSAGSESGAGGTGEKQQQQQSS
jgi:radical SAM modification target selenobiotic family peptide